MVKRSLFTCSQSKISTWRRCKYAYFLKYIEKLRRKKKSRPLRFGSLAHDMLEAEANGDDPFKVLDKAVADLKPMFAAEREEYLETIEDVRLIMTDYLSMDWGKNELTPIRVKKRSAEHKFTVPLVEGIELTGRLDVFSKTPDRRTWLTENKTFGKLPNEDHRWRNLQSNIYIRVCDMLGLKFDGFAWNYIRSKPPSVPKILKDGTVSQKRLDTLPATLHEFFKRSRLPPNQRMIATAEANRKNYFIRLLQPIKRKTVDAVWGDLIESAREAADYGGVLKAKTVDRHCDWCEFESICRAELTGGDVKFVKKREYEVHEKPEDDGPTLTVE